MAGEGRHLAVWGREKPKRLLSRILASIPETERPRTKPGPEWDRVRPLSCGMFFVGRHPRQGRGFGFVGTLGLVVRLVPLGLPLERD